MARVAGVWWGSAVACAMAWSVGVCRGSLPPMQTPRAVAAKITSPVASNPASIAAGQALYGDYCVPPRRDRPRRRPASSEGHEAVQPDRHHLGSRLEPREIFVIIQEAPAEFKMKGLKGKVSEQDTWHLVNYVRSLGGVAK